MAELKSVSKVPVFFDYTKWNPHNRHIVGKTRPGLTQFFEKKRPVRGKKND